MAVEMGWGGFGDVKGAAVPLISASISGNQTPWLVDDVPQGTNQKKYVWSNKYEPGGNISFYLTKSGSFSSGGLIEGNNSSCDEALSPFGSVGAGFSCGGGVQISGCVGTSLSISCSAGDLARVSLDVKGSGYSNSFTSGQATEDALVTWADCSVTGFADVSSFECSIENGCESVYVIGSGTLVPDFYMPGILNGSARVTCMSDSGPSTPLALTPSGYIAGADYDFSVPGISITLTGVAHSLQGSTGTGTAVFTYVITGTDSVWSI